MDRRVEFGQDLRRRRIERDVSLDEVARITKIRKVYLEGLEEGRFEELPGSEIFVVGFVRAYAKHLGLDEDSLVARYREAVGAMASPPAPHPKYLVVPRERRWHLGPFLLGGLLLGGGWWAFWFLQHRAPATGSPSGSAPPKVVGSSTSAPSPPPTALPEEEAPAPVEGGEPAMPQPEAPGPLQLPPSTPPPPGQDPGDRKAQAAAGDLVVETTEPCWMEIWAGSTRALYRLVEPGEKIALNGTAFTVTLGNREAATVRWKGAPLIPPPGEGMVVNRWKIPQPPGEEVEEP